MNRIDVLEKKLPPEVLSLIRLYDSHPAADLIREIEFCPFPATKEHSAGVILKISSPKCFLPAVKELKRRLYHNRTRHIHGGCWLPLFFCHRSWRLTFERWQYENALELDYLLDWARRDFVAGVPN